MAELRDDYLDYLNTSGLLDEERFAPHEESRSRRPSSSMRALRPGESLPSWGGGDVSEPLIGPGDLYGPIASKLGTETADLLVPYLMKSVSRMAPLLNEAQRALRSQRGSVGFPGKGAGDDPLGFLSPEARARLEALQKDRPSARSGRGSEELSQEMGLSRAPEATGPSSYTEREDLEALTDMVKRLTQGQGKEDIPMADVLRGRPRISGLPTADDEQDVLGYWLEQLAQSAPGAGPKIEDLLKGWRH